MDSKEVKEEKKVLREGNISLILESYDDLFSDFDPRPYSEKALSDDFLQECKRAVRDKEEKNAELRLLVPKQKRNLADEAKIKNRMKGHFQKHYNEKNKELKKLKKEGYMWFGLGLISMLASTFFYDPQEFWRKFLLIILEPAGWFFFWEGLDKVFITAKELKPDYDFYKKMSEVRIIFNSY